MAAISSYCLDTSPKEVIDFAEILLEMNLHEKIMGVTLMLGSMLAVVPQVKLSLFYQYLLQHINLWRTRSSEGISFWWLFFSNVNQFSSIINATLLKFPKIRACTVLV